MNNEFLKFGIIGKPLSHSISPAIQTAALESVNKNGSYEKFETSTENLPNLIKFFLENNFSGFNVTIPHKIEIIKYLDEIDETAQKIGAVNTVKITNDKKLVGFNTDIFGFFASLENKKVTNAKILGCGGAALAVIFALDKLSCKNITIYARNLEKANDFIRKIENKTTINLTAKNLNDISSLKDTDILINCTPLGTNGENIDKTAIPKDIFASANPNMIVYDLVYNPQETLFLKYAKEYNLDTINGLNMLILQGAKAFEIWTGFFPNINNMKEKATEILFTQK